MIEYGCCELIKVNLQSFFGCTPQNCHRSKRERLMHKTLDMVKEEMKITSLLQFIRVTKAALRKVHTQQQWQSLQKRYKVRTIEYSKRRNYWRIKSFSQRQVGENQSFSESNIGLSARGEYAEDKEYGNDNKLGQLYGLHETQNSQRKKLHCASDGDITLRQ